MIYITKDKSINELTSKIIGCAIEVHKSLGPGLLEKVYEECLCQELKTQDISFERQKEIPVIYKGIKLDLNYRVDVLIEDKVILEIKSATELLPIHEAQLLNYLKLSDIKTGLIINFNVKKLSKGIKRIVN